MKKVAALVESGTVPGLTVKSHVWKLFPNKRTAKKAGAFGFTTVEPKNLGPGTFRCWVSGETVVVFGG